MTDKHGLSASLDGVKVAGKLSVADESKTFNSQRDTANWQANHINYLFEALIECGFQHEDAMRLTCASISG